MKEFAQLLAVDYPLLSDPTKETATAYGVVTPTSPWATRWTFYIGTDGRVLFIDKAVNPASHGKAIVDKLTELGVSRRTLRPRVP